jgi:hypothetical protein
VSAELVARSGHVHFTGRVSPEPIMQPLLILRELQSNNSIMSRWDFELQYVLFKATQSDRANKKLELWHDFRICIFEGRENVVVETSRGLEWVEMKKPK